MTKQFRHRGWPPLHLTLRARQLTHATCTLGNLSVLGARGGCLRPDGLLRGGMATLAGRSGSDAWEAVKDMETKDGKWMPTVEDVLKDLRG